MRKLLFFDIDGTILTEGQNRYVPESAKQTIRQLQAQGHLCFINTGRSWAEIHENITSLGFDGFVCGCGTHIRYHDEILLAHQVDQELADSLLTDLEQFRLEWLLEGQHRIYYSNIPYTTHIGDFHREYHQVFPDKCTDIPPDTRGVSFDKFCICTRPDSQLTDFQAKYREQFTFIDRGKGFYEVVPTGFSKASGIHFLMEYFSIPLEDTIAIGDSTNDMPMLTFAGFSIGMKHSDQIVLDTVDYVTDSVENDGIYKAIKHLQLI